VQTLSSGFCAVLPLIKGLKHGLVLTPICSLALGAFNAKINQFSKGDSTQGAGVARAQIEAQVKAKADELTEINWEALMAIFKKVDSFNRANKKELNTKTPCPNPSQSLVNIMGLTDSKGNLKTNP
jgi:hypothetical protein